MKKIFVFLTGTVLLAISCTKQDQQMDATPEQDAALTEGRHCASHELLEEQIAKNPARGKFLEELEIKTLNFKGRNIANRGSGIITLQVVVHIVSTNPGLVTDAQVASQIAVLNKDFNKQNTELSNSGIYLAGYNYNSVPNCQIQFALNQTIRKTTSTTSFGTNDAVKKAATGSAPVNPTKYLNIWVCDLSSGLLGYAQFPGGSSATDGVVLDYQAFGTSAATTGYSLYAAYNLGRTATHEVGHWFNLRHIWGDTRCGNDQVTDTPLHDASNGGCPANTLRSRCSGKPLEQWMNYMDYTYDGCMYMFTAGQKTRMDAAIDGARLSYFQ